MPLARIVAAALFAAASFGPQALAQDQVGDRNGPFVKTDLGLGTLLEQGYEIKGILGGGLILVRESQLYSCSLVPDHEALSYKPQFECSILDELTETADR